MPTGLCNTVCGVCGATAFYSYGEHESRPRCVRCHEVERSLAHYAGFDKGRAFIKHVLENIHEGLKSES